MLHHWVSGLRLKTCKKKFFIDISTLEDEHTMFLWNMRNRAPNNTVLHPRKPVLSTMPLQKLHTQDLTVTITRNSGNYGKMEKKQKHKAKIWQSPM